MKKRNTNIWDIIAWLALIRIVIWFILKMPGIIQTPSWLDYAPILSASYISGWIIYKLQVIERRTKELIKKS